LFALISGGVVLSLVALPAAGQRSAGPGSPTAITAGDPAKGRSAIESNACLTCHRIGDTGSRLGPDLSDVGTLRPPDALRRALVTPDAEVYPEHRFVRVVTKNGATVVGRLLNQDAFSIQLLTQDEQLKSYLKSDLREHTILDKGLMPSYDTKLTPQQIADIVSYLETLKGDAK
jgi:putative heme-binding domain-containing protein